jgi:RimJ/RimL family protein N-acetyltransferase
MSASTSSLQATRLVGHWGGLRPLDPANDASPIFRLSHDDNKDATWQEMKVGPFPTRSAFLKHVAELVADPKRAFFAVVGQDDLALGWLCLMEATSDRNSIELGYVLFPPIMQRTTLATEAFFLIIAHVFDDLSFQRLEWTCTATNARSRRAADRLGFTFEGVMRDKFIVKERSRDIAIYSLLADEWPLRRNAMRDWLRPENFEDGRQLQKLIHKSG